MRDGIFEFGFNGSSLATVATLLIGCFVLRDTVRVCLYIFKASRRHGRRFRLRNRDDA